MRKAARLRLISCRRRQRWRVAEVEWDGRWCGRRCSLSVSTSVERARIRPGEVSCLAYAVQSNRLIGINWRAVIGLRPSKVARSRRDG